MQKEASVEAEAKQNKSIEESLPVDEDKPSTQSSEAPCEELRRFFIGSGAQLADDLTTPIYSDAEYEQFFRNRSSEVQVIRWATSNDRLLVRRVPEPAWRNAIDFTPTIHKFVARWRRV